MAGWMIALVRSTRAVCSGELSLLSSMSVGGGGGEEIPSGPRSGKGTQTESDIAIQRSKCGFTVKQDATTIRKISATCTVSTSSLTMEGEVVTQEWRDEAVDNFP